MPGEVEPVSLTVDDVDDPETGSHHESGDGKTQACYRGPFSLHRQWCGNIDHKQGDSQRGECPSGLDNVLLLGGKAEWQQPRTSQPGQECGAGKPDRKSTRLNSSH